MKTLLINFSGSIPDLNLSNKYEFYYQIGILNEPPKGKICVNDQDRLNKIAQSELKDYSDWIYNINKSFLNQNLILNQNLSLFFLTDISNKRSELFDTYNNICNIILIKQIIHENKIKKIIIHKADNLFLESIKSLLNVRILIFKKRKNLKLIKYSFAFRILKHLNLILKYFIYQLVLYPIIRKDFHKEHKCNNVFFTRYPIHFPKDTIFEEKYTYLVTKKDKYITNLNADGLHQSLGILKCIKCRLKIKNKNPNQHIIVDDFINIKNLIRSFIDIFKLLKPFLILSKKKYIYKGNNVSLSMKIEYSHSFQRLLALLICHRGLENLLKNTYAKKYIFYLNEYAFGRMITYTLHKNKIINTVGMQHGAISRRKLCICLSTKEIPNNNFNYLTSVPLPKQILVEDKISKNIYEIFGQANCKIMKKVPRLYYLNKIKKSKIRKKILIVPGLHDFEMIYKFMLKTIKNNKKVTFFIKPHPKSKLKLKKFNFPKNVQITNEHISKLLKSAEKVYVSYSSVALEAKALNIPVKQIEYPGKVNELGINEIFENK